MILGQHSITEVKDLLKAKDSELADMQKAFVSFGPTWSKSDAATFSAWSKDYDSLKNRYAIASTEAKAEIVAGEMVPLLSDDNIPSETGYQAVIHSLQPVPGTVTTGDLQDLFTRIQAAQVNAGQQAYKETPVQQPTKGSDTDLNVLNAATAAQKAIEKNKPSPAVQAGLIVGGVAALLVTLKIML